MEDVLDVYQRAYDPLRPQVCVDETSKQLLDHVRVPIPASRGVPARVDDEYCRCGTANIFMAVEPLTGRVMTQATERRTSVDFAKFLRWRSDEEYPAAEQIVLVMDNLSTHCLQHSTKRSSRQKRDGWHNASSCTSRPGTAVGSTSPRFNSRYYPGKHWISASHRWGNCALS
jgi:hypothetical protein